MFSPFEFIYTFSGQKECTGLTYVKQRGILTMGDDMRFSEYITARGFTVKSLAEKAGVNPRSLEQYSTGRYPLKNARAWFVVAIAEALDTTPKELLSLDD